MFCFPELSLPTVSAHEPEFHDGYDHEHVPERARIPGFRTVVPGAAVTTEKDIPLRVAVLRMRGVSAGQE